MKGTRLILPLVVLGASMLLAGCFKPTVDPFDIESAITVEVDSDTYSYDATLDLGAADPDLDPVTLAGVVRNTTGLDVVVKEFSIDNALFSAEVPALPVTVAAGEGVAVSLSFDPVAIGPEAAVLSVTVEGVALPFVLNLTGDGNVAPVAREAVVVSGAGTPSFYRS